MEDRCTFFLEKKRRRCNFPSVSGTSFCTHHAPEIPGQADSGMRNVPCPLDPNHWVWEKNLQRHLKKCNKVKVKATQEGLSCFSENVNASTSDAEDGVATRSLSQMSNDELLKWAARIEAMFDMAVSLAQCSPDAVLSEVAAPLAPFVSPFKAQRTEEEEDAKNDVNQKHAEQQDAIVARLGAAGLVSPRLLYVEFGAGKGSLSHWVCEATGRKSKHLLLEREARRHKYDKHHRDHNAYQRIRLDIIHFDSTKLDPCLLEDCDGVVGIGKHMCGAGTDLSLRCLLRLDSRTDSRIDCSVQDDDQQSNPKRRKTQPLLNGFGIATCCHHLCDWRLYVNKRFMIDLGVSPADFALLCQTTSWGVSGSIRPGAEVSEEQVMQGLQPISSQRKSTLGKKAKRIIDLGRLLLLRSQRFVGDLVAYCSHDLSPENYLLVASRKDSLAVAVQQT